MIRKILLATMCVVGACIVPESSSGNTTALKAKVEKDPSKYISDNGKGVAFVKCARDDSYLAGPNEMARAVVDGCDAALTAALARFPEIIDVDPVIVDGTTAGYMVLYAVPSAAPMTPASGPVSPFVPGGTPVSPLAPGGTPASPYPAGQ